MEAERRASGLRLCSGDLGLRSAGGNRPSLPVGGAISCSASCAIRLWGSHRAGWRKLLSNCGLDRVACLSGPTRIAALSDRRTVVDNRGNVGGSFAVLRAGASQIWQRQGHTASRALRRAARCDAAPASDDLARHTNEVLGEIGIAGDRLEILRSKGLICHITIIITLRFPCSQLSVNLHLFVRGCRKASSVSPFRQSS